nr:hypothetical protein [Pseudoroseomonas deserti]
MRDTDGWQGFPLNDAVQAQPSHLMAGTGAVRQEADAHAAAWRHCGIPPGVSQHVAGADMADDLGTPDRCDGKASIKRQGPAVQAKIAAGEDHVSDETAVPVARHLIGQGRRHTASNTTDAKSPAAEYLQYFRYLSFLYIM